MDEVRAHLAAQELQLRSPGTPVSFHGESMRPFLCDGDELTVEPVGFAGVRAGDIVTCRLDHRFPTLRVMGRTRTKLRLRGDGWPFADFDAWPEDLVGRVTTRRRGAATLSSREWPWRAAAVRALAGDRLRRAKRVASRRSRQVASGLSRRIRHALGPRADRPAGIHVNISASCNLGCRMCPYLAVHDDAGYAREMTEETFRQLLPAVKDVPAIILSGSGEPFFNRRAVAFIEMARAVNPRLDVDITTNGTLVTERLARELVRVRLSKLVFSIDGATEATVASIRIGVNLGKVLDNLRTVARVKAEMGSALPRLMVNYMIGYGSYEELPAFLRSARSLGVAEVHVLEVITGSAEAARSSLRECLARDGGRTVREAKRVADAAGITLLWPTTLNNKCLHPSVPHVSESGDVSPCCYVDYEGRTLWADEQEVRLPRIAYGNVTSESFARIWRAPDFQHFRDRNRRGDFTPFCRTCHSVRAATSAAVLDVLK